MYAFLLTPYVFANNFASAKDLVVSKTSNMRKIILAILCFQFAYIVSTAQTTKPAKCIAGVWQLVEFVDLDYTTDTWIYRYGKKYSMSINDYKTKNSFNNFGTDTFEAVKGKRHHVEGGTIPWHADTKLPHQIRLKAYTSIGLYPNNAF